MKNVIFQSLFDKFWNFSITVSEFFFCLWYLPTFQELTSSVKASLGSAISALALFARE